MKRRILFTIVCFMVGVLAYSTPRDKSDVVRIAQLNIRTKASQSDPAKDYSSLPEVQMVDSSLAYYVFNAENNFVLVSTDDRLPLILGYGDTLYNPTNIPPALAYLLAEYDNELQYLNQSGQLRSDMPLTSTFLDEQPPLLATQWSQSKPYNNLTPYYDAEHRSATGCVATAMAQIMNYYHYPTKGSGSNSYYWYSSKDSANYNATLSADFSNTTYDWNNMLPTYTGSSYSETQAQAVATLMYHCGIAVKMNYGASSGAYTDTTPLALNSFFNYDPNYQSIHKYMYSPDSFAAIVHDEIKNKRPVLIAGSNSQGGHAFVCDGYDIDGFFHINWGWNGTSDGYFLLSALNPARQGIGGTNYGYNSNTRAFIGIQPFNPRANPPYPQIVIDSLTLNKTCMKRNANFNITLHTFLNAGLHPFTGYYYIALADEDDNFIIRLSGQRRVLDLKNNYYYIAPSFSSITIPRSIQPGTYHLYTLYKDDNYDSLRLLCRYADNYKTLYITDTSICTVPNDAQPELQLTSTIRFAHPNNIPFSGDSLIFSIKNTGARFIGDISARIYQGTTARGEYQSLKNTTIKRGQTLDTAIINTFRNNLSINTTYTLRLCSKNKNTNTLDTLKPLHYNNIPFRIFGYNTIINDSICPGSNYENNGFNISKPDLPQIGQTKQYTKTIPINETRDSIVLLNLKTITPPSSSTYITICEGMTYNFHGTKYSQPNPNNQPYSYFSPQEQGCDSVYYLYLQVNPAIKDTIRASICQGDTLIFRNDTFTTASPLNQPYIIKIHPDTTCDTLFYLFLSVTQTLDSTIRVSIKQGSTFPFHGKEYSQPNTNNQPYTIRITSNDNKCDSIYYLYINILQPYDSIISTTICAGEYYTFRGTNYPITNSTTRPHNVLQKSQSNTIPDTIYHLYVFKQSPNVEDIYASVKTGKTYTFRGIEYTPTNDNTPYVITIPQEKGKCDSIYNLYLSILPTYDTTVFGSVCNGKAFIFRGNYYSINPTPYTITEYHVQAYGSTDNDPDTIFNLYLQTISVLDTFIVAELCQGQTYNFRGVRYTQPSSDKPYTIVAPASSPTECDTTFHLYINVNNMNVTTIHKSICQGETYNFRGIEYSQDKGFEPYIITIPQKDQCDSIYYIYLTVKQPYKETLNVTICEGDAYEFRDEEFSIPSQDEPYIITLSNAQSCDSIFYLYLNTQTPTPDSIFASICPGDTYEFEGETFSHPRPEPYAITSPNYNDPYACDNYYLLFLSYQNPDTTFISVFYDQNTITLPYQIDEYYTIQQNITSDTTIFVKTNKNSCSYNAYKISTSPQSFIPSTKSDIVKIEIIDMLGNKLYEQIFHSPLPYTNLNSKIQSLNQKIKPTHGICIMHCLFKDGSSIRFKNTRHYP